MLPPDQSSTGLAVVDLGYAGTVGMVAIPAGPSVPPGAAAKFYVKQSREDLLSDATACSADAVPLQAGGWVAQACNLTGRFDIGRERGGASLQCAGGLCEFCIDWKPLLMHRACPACLHRCSAGMWL